jgi:hypothetical protein
MKFLFLLFIACLPPALLAQDLKPIEQELLQHLNKIENWQGYYGTEKKLLALDSLIQENYIFKTKMLRYTSDHPSTISYPFKDLQAKGLNIATSADGKLRIYSWNTQLGGTMQHFENVYQFSNGKKARSPKQQKGDPGAWFSEIFTIATKSGTVYLGYLHATYSTKEAYQGIKLFSIDGSALNDTLSLFKTKTNMRNEVGCNFDFFSVVDRKERPVKLIYFDAKNKILKIPVVTEKGKVTDKFITYKFTGTYFEETL